LDIEGPKPDELCCISFRNDMKTGEETPTYNTNFICSKKPKVAHCVHAVKKIAHSLLANCFESTDE
jgi:hypothetical protein